MASILSFPSLQVTTINNFTPGVVKFGRGSYPLAYSTEAPLGSASSSFRCYAIPNIGLCPFPTYTTIDTLTSTGNLNITTCDILQSNSPAFWMVVTQTVPSLYPVMTVRSEQNIGGSPSFAGTIYTTPTPYAAGSPLFPIWPNLASIFATVGANLQSTEAWVDPFNNPTKYVAYDHIGLAITSNNLPTAVANTPISANLLYNTSRILFLIGNQVYASGQQILGSVTGPEFFYPELGVNFGSWGSISAGELLLIYQGGGGLIVYGDPAFPSDVVELPGIQGTGLARGRAVPTQAGLIYTTDSDGAYLWNGGNTSSKISSNIPDDQLFRGTASIGVMFPFQLASASSSQSDQFGHWVMFANNWMYDTVTGSWWQAEDPSVNNFAVHRATNFSSRFFLSATGTVNAGSPGTLRLVQWDATLPAHTYTWVSNPIPSPGSDVTLGAVEICASNPSPTSCTVVVTPTAPPSQTPFPNQSATQAATFTIPATTAGYRQALQLGWNDYNLCVQVVATNTNTSNPAPILHEINLGYTLRNS